MAMETHDLFAMTADVIGRDGLASALHVGVKHTYNLTADPMTLEVPCRNDAERMQNVFEKLATYPEGKPALILWRMHFNELFSRLIDHENARPLTPETVLVEAQELCAEVADVLRECKPGFVPEKLSKEAAELIAVLERIVHMAEASDDVRSTVPFRKVR
jgi:hypothetical protein